MSIEKFINEYRTRKAIRKYVEGEISLGKAAEVAGMSKRKWVFGKWVFGILSCSDQNIGDFLVFSI